MTLSSQYPFNFRQGFTSIWAVLILLIQLNSPNPKCICGTDLSFHPNSILRSYKHTISFTPVPMWKQHWKCYHSLSDLMLMLQVESRYGQGWLCCCCCCTGSSVAFSSCGEWGLPSSCGAQASHCVGFSYGRAQALGARASACCFLFLINPLFLISSWQWERVKRHTVLRTEIMGKGICLDFFQ